MRKLVFVLTMLTTQLFGQVVQYGKVELFDDDAPLAGVAFTIPSEHDCQPTMSDSKGCFRLCFAKHHVGDVVSGIEMRKQGYEVVNVHVTRQWTLTTADTLRVVMAPTDKVKKARTLYYELSGLLPEQTLWSDGIGLYEVVSSLYSFNISRFSQGIAPSDVDVDIPVTEVVNDKTFAVIIANEDYQQEQNVPFAIHDGEVFKEYCGQLLGVPEQNIRFVTNATLNNMRYAVDWLRATLEAYHGEARGIFYYSGHGMPDEMSRNAYLLPVDGYGTNMESGFGLDALYAQLGSANAESVLYFVDACFSGATREGDMLAESRGVAVNTKAGELQGNAIAFSAAQGYETAYAYQEKSHGLFTYFLLKKLKESRGDITAGELADYLYDTISRMSAVVGMKTQHPSANGVVTEWRTMRLR